MCDWDSASSYSLFDNFVSSCESSEWEDQDDDDEVDDFQNCIEMAGSAVTEVVMGSTPKIGRRSMALADIDPKYVSQSGIWEASEVETARGSIRIQHLTTAVSTLTGARPLSITTTGCTYHGHGHGGSHGIGSTSSGMTRFPKLEECAHFHYDVVDLPHLKFGLREDQVQRCLTSCNRTGVVGDEPVCSLGVGGDDRDKYSNFSIEILSGGQCWLFRRTVANWIKLDEQLHKCVWDRQFSELEDLEKKWNLHQFSTTEIRGGIEKYLERLTILPTNQITCGTVLSWFEIDNRGRHIISSDDAALNTPAVAAALAIKSYTAQAPDELSFRVGEMISVIDMPPPEESIWLRGKLTRESHEMGINFEVGFFPREYIEIIGEKVKFHSGTVTPAQTTRRLARVSVTSTTSTSSPIPDKPVLRKHGKIISFFRSMMSRPEKRVLQQKGILRERVFNCDLAEHLLNTGSEIPIILKTCAEFIEIFGISDGIYRVSGSLRNTQRLRRLFDADEVPILGEDEGIRQDVHAVSSVLKQYFRELPNPLCTYQLYEKFVHAISPPSNKERFENIKEVIKELPPPHYRTLEYLMLHLNKMTLHSEETGMTAQNMAIVWAPNLIRCRDLEGGSAAEFKGVSNHVIVTEFVIRYAERFFGKDKTPLPNSAEKSQHGLGRPESLLLSSSSPMKLMSLEAAKQKLSQGRSYIEVGGGPASLPPVYHTVIDTSKRRGGIKGAGGWKNFFSRNRSFSKGQRKAAPDIRVVMNTAMNVKDGTVPGFGHKLRPVRSEESLISTPYEIPVVQPVPTRALENTLEVDENVEVDECPEVSASSPASPVSDGFIMSFNPSQNKGTVAMTETQQTAQALSVDPSKTHNRSISHDSYFESQMKRLGMIPLEIYEEDGELINSKISLAMSTSLDEPGQKDRSSGIYGDCDSNSSVRNRSSFSSACPTPNASPSVTSLRPTYLPMPTTSPSSDSTSSIHSVSVQVKGHVYQRPTAKPRLSKLKDCQVQTSTTAVNDVGVSTMDEETGYEPEARTGFGDVYQYPTFSEIEKQEILSYELDVNSSVDNSSTDTTPGMDPYSVTNVVYSPLLNELTSSTESSSDPGSVTVEPGGCADDSKVQAQVDQNVISVHVPSREISLGLEIPCGDEVHYENLQSLHEYNSRNDTRTISDSATDDLTLIDGSSVKEDCEGVTSEADSLAFDSLAIVSSEITEVQTPMADEDFERKEQIESAEDSSPTGDSAYSEELDQDSENVYTKIKLESGEEEEGSSEDLEQSPLCLTEPCNIDNPLYGLPSVDIDPEVMSAEVQKISDEYNHQDETETPTREKTFGRCNSAPLNDYPLVVKPSSEADSESESKMTLSLSRTSSVVREQKLLLCKRLSEPSLNSQGDKGSWSYADAKRLTHRKQSVRELLNKFEATGTGQDSVPQPVSLSPSPSPTRVSPLPKAKNGKLSSEVVETRECLRDRNNTRYQHHRFSLGDILISETLNVADVDKRQGEGPSGGTTLMTRSDTYPELRNNEATKENVSTVVKKAIVPEKIVHLFEVANTTVDNSDPNTRERIEKYKNNRRTFLREKYSSGNGLSKSEGEDRSRNSSTSSTATPTADRDSVSSTESVFVGTVPPAGGDRVTGGGGESPRKRALSEDTASILAQNQFKAFKSEGEILTSSSNSTPGLPRPPTAKKIPPSDGNGNPTKSETHPPLGSNLRLNIRSCPPGSILPTTGSSTSVDPVKCHWSSTPSIARSSLTLTTSAAAMEGKKIKDIAAFFERKQF